MKDFPLNKMNRLTIARAFRHHARVDMAIDCIVEGQMGQAFVDDPAQPTVFFLQMSDFFGYLGGDADCPAGLEMVAALKPPVLLMPGVMDGPDPWMESVKAHAPGRVIPVDRYRFSGAGITLNHLDGLLREAPYRDQARRIDPILAGRLTENAGDWIDLSVYESPEDFYARSIGYCVLDGEELLGVAYGSLVCSRGIEVSVVVRPEHRQRGMATTLSALLLRYCLENNMDANWDAANPESCKLALKLGYKALGAYTASFLTDLK